MRWLDGIIDLMNMNSEQTPGDSEGQGSLSCYRSMGSQRLGHNLATEQQQQNICIFIHSHINE